MTPLATHRRDLGYRVVDVAALAGVSLQTVRKIEEMDYGVRLDSVYRVAYALGLAPSDLYPALAERRPLRARTWEYTPKSSRQNP